MLGNAFPVSLINSIIPIWINTVDNDDVQAATCYPLPSPGAQDSPFYQAKTTTLQPLQSVLTAVDIGKIRQLDALLAKAASMDANYQKLQETKTLQKQHGIMYKVRK